MVHTLRFHHGDKTYCFYFECEDAACANKYEFTSMNPEAVGCEYGPADGPRCKPLPKDAPPPKRELTCPV